MNDTADSLFLIPDAACQLADRQRYLFMGDATVPLRRVVMAQALAARLATPLTRLAPFRLHILHINDLHGQLARLTPAGDAPVLARMVWRLRQLHQQCANDPHTAVLFLSAGDEMVGTLFDEWLLPGGEGGHAAYQALSAAALDAGALGNHDLDLGTAVLAQSIRQDARFPLLCANLGPVPLLRGLVYPAALLVVKGVRVGVIGLTTAAQRSGPERELVRFADPLAVLSNLLPLIRPWCDVLILLSHLGYRFDANTLAGGQLGDEALARALPPRSLALIIGGHTHHALNEAGLEAQRVVNGIPIVQAGAMGRFLGEVTLTLRGRPAVTHAQLTQVADLPVDAAFDAQTIQPLLRRLEPLRQRPLGLAIDHPDLRETAVQNDLDAGESALANFVTAGLLAQARAHGYAADLAMTDAAILRTGLPPGPITLAHWFALMPYADTLCLYQLSGAELLALLQDNARRAARADEPRLERGFLHFSAALRYAIDPGAARAQAKITEATFDDLPIAPDRTFTLVSHSFLRQLARPWEQQARAAGLPLFDLAQWPQTPTPHFVRPSLVAYVQEMGGVTEKGGAVRDGRVSVNLET